MTFTGIPLMRFAVTFVCSGNTCRSAMAAAVLESLLAGSPVAEQVVVDSYGTGDWHVGEPADPRALAVLAEHGLDASAHRARVIPADLLSRSDLILCAEARHRRRVCRLGVAGAGQHARQFVAIHAHSRGDIEHGGQIGDIHIIDEIRPVGGKTELARLERAAVVEPQKRPRGVLGGNWKRGGLPVGHAKIAGRALDVVHRIGPLERNARQRPKAGHLERDTEQKGVPVHEAPVAGSQGVDFLGGKIAVGR